ASAPARVVAPPPNDYAITDAQITQGVQSADGSIPMVLQGNAAVVNVLVSAVDATSRPVQVVLRLLDRSGAVVRADTTSPTFIGGSPRWDQPTVQFLVPATTLAPGLRWQVEVDPRHVSGDTVAADNLFPRGAPRALVTVSVPPLSIRLVPVVLLA